VSHKLVQILQLQNLPTQVSCNVLSNFVFVGKLIWTMSNMKEVSPKHNLPYNLAIGSKANRMKWILKELCACVARTKQECQIQLTSCEYGTEVQQRKWALETRRNRQGAAVLCKDYPMLLLPWSSWALSSWCSGPSPYLPSAVAVAVVTRFSRQFVCSPMDKAKGHTGRRRRRRSLQEWGTLTPSESPLTTP
jgi:hypothetical protein